MDLDQSRIRNDFKDRNDIPPAKRMRFGVPGDIDTQPPMMTFKAFLQSQDDNISDEEATSKYAEYKLEFRRQQLNDFFNAHKDEEWFKLKYHPEESLKRKAELNAAIHKRTRIFLDLLDSRKIDSISLDMDCSSDVEKLLDSVVIKLEGGSDIDLVTLDNKQVSETKSDKGEIQKTEKSCNEDNSNPNSEDMDITVRKKKGYEWIIVDDVGGDDEDVNTKLDHINDIIQFSENRKSMKDETSEKRKDMTLSEKKENHKEELNDLIPLTPCPLHKTRSIFLRNISPRITKAEIEEVCQKYPGFLRIWLSDAQPDQHWCRRGFVTFRRHVNIKQICWNLNNVKIKDCEWQVGVNHDLSKRSRVVSGLTLHKKVVFSDLKLAVKIIQELDSRAGLWIPNKEANSFFEKENPLFKNITDYIVEEAPAESEELLGKQATADEFTQGSADAIRVLDKLLLYLRIVHSVDYYNASQYTTEDEMPNRCGIIHLRGPSTQKVSEKEVDEYIEAQKKKLEPLFTPLHVVSETELISLGMKDKESEVEKFIMANTQELAKGKWLCPLSGKKFKAPEFIRKHMMNKFTQEIENIQEEVDYFNNYLKDIKRPELPEHPGFLVGKKEHEFAYHFPFAGGFRRGYGFGHFGGHGFFRGRGGMGRGRGMDFRPVVNYRDLDSPCEADEVL